MLNQTKNLLIGLFVVVACGLIIGVILFIEPSIGDGKQVLNIRFSNINGISVGTRVAFAGKPVGEVVEIKSIPQSRQEHFSGHDQIYYYQLTCHIDSHVKVYTTDEVTVQTSGLLGEKSVAILPRPAPPGITPQLVTPNHPLYASSDDSLQSAFKTISHLATKIEDAVESITDWVDKNGAALGNAARSFDMAMLEFGQTMHDINQECVVASANDTLNSIRITSDKIGDTITTLTDDEVFANLADIMHAVKSASYSFDDILKSIQEGKGTLGRIIHDDDFYLSLMNILTKADTTLNDINHYGLLFNLNKQWQRSRQKKITELNALNSPEQFKDYYEKEMDQINTTISRLSMLIDKAESSPDREKILRNPVYRKDFAEFLRLVHDLLQNLRLYNENLQSKYKENFGGCS